VVVTDADGRVRFANRSADRLLSEGHSLDATRGRLRARRPQDSEALRVLIARAARTAVGADNRAVEAMAVQREDERPPVAVVAEPLAPTHADALEQADAGAILFLSGAAEASRPPAAHLRIVYGLTPAEADVAAHIASGDGVPAAAAALGVSEKTVKAHLSAIFGKVGVTRQAQLVRRVMADLGGLAPDEGMAAASASRAPSTLHAPPPG
jgi:DNA-binding CsgD family transcriptional regulator